ncbi:hypothetical protein N6W67_03075 [Proteus mirabilis]|nr:hypothetical protein [Proteus mirabilis]UXJ01221.1 hypothetical protein N6W67_03075 [Proteus mirabilis]
MIYDYWIDYDYDATGQLVGITDAGERHILLRRNRRGQVIARRDPAGHWLHFHYDTFGRTRPSAVLK